MDNYLKNTILALKRDKSYSHLSLNILVIFLLPLFYVSFIQSDQLVNGIWTGKEFYFYFISVIVFLVGLIMLFFNKRELEFSFNMLDASLLAYYFYNIVRLVFTEHIPLYNTRIIQFTFLLLFYFIFKNYFKKLNSNNFAPAYILIIAFLIAGFWQASIGLFQSHNLFGYHSGYFKVLGTFGNPAPYTGFIISVLPFSLGLFLLLDNKSIFTKILKYSGGLTFAVTILVLPATKTRGGWLAALAGILTVLFYKYNLSVKFNTIFNNRIKKLSVSFSIISIIVLLFIGLYQIRPSSAFGRLLIWKVSLTKIIPQNPIFGIGYDCFGQVYNLYQGNYFAEQDRAEFEKYVAGNVKQAHNEYIEQTAELGLIGLLLFVGLLTVSVSKTTYTNQETIKNSKFKIQNHLVVSAKASIIALMVSACFSYPLQILPTLLNFIFLLSIISSISNYKILHTLKIKKALLRFLSVTLLLLLLFFSITEVENYNNQKKWASAVMLSHYQSYDKAISIYENLHCKLNHQGNFLVNYGGVLSLNGQHKEAIKILNEAKSINSDPNLFISLGNSYKETGKIKNAIAEYEIASSIIPHKFYPKYLLAKLYNENGNIKEAKAVAREIIDMNEKISSSATSQIKKEMKELLNNNLPDEAK